MPEARKKHTCMIEIEPVEQTTLFDYAVLDTETRVFVQEQETELGGVLKRTSEEIGNILLKVKKRLPHGHYMPWLASRGISQPTAWRCFQAAMGKPIKSFIMNDLPVAMPAKQAELPPQLAFDEEENEEVHEETEEDRYQTAVDMGTTDLYYDELRREAVKRDEEKRKTKHEKETPPVDGRNRDNIPLAVPHISSKNNEWYTPERYLRAVLAVMDCIDLDPASCAQANSVVRAAKYYDVQTNGLDKVWPGHVWLNPPYGRSEDGSNQDIWSSRLIDQYENGPTTEAILLVNAAVDTKWFQRLFAYPVCFPHQRINFSTPEVTISGSTHGSAFVYFGYNTQRFVEAFSEFGTVVKRWT